MGFRAVGSQLANRSYVSISAVECVNLSREKDWIRSNKTLRLHHLGHDTQHPQAVEKHINAFSDLWQNRDSGQRINVLHICPTCTDNVAPDRPDRASTKGNN